MNTSVKKVERSSGISRIPSNHPVAPSNGGATAFEGDPMHFRSILQFSFAALLLALFAAGAQAQCNHDPNVQVGGTWECQDHTSLYGGGYPYSEDFVHNV